MPQTITISVDLFNAILANLSNQPYAQVAPLLETIKKAMNESNTAPESAPVATTEPTEETTHVTE